MKKAIKPLNRDIISANTNLPAKNESIVELANKVLIKPKNVFRKNNPTKIETVIQITPKILYIMSVKILNTFFSYKFNQVQSNIFSKISNFEKRIKSTLKKIGNTRCFV